MSETTPPTDTNTDAKKPDPEKKDDKKPAMSRGRKWRRRIIVFLVVVIALAFLIRAAVPILLPTVMTKVAATFGLKAEYDDMDLYAAGGDVGLWNLRITPLSGGEPILRMAYCRASISPLALLKGRLDIRRVEADDAGIVIERTADGKIPVLEQVLGVAQWRVEQALPAESEPLSLDPPFKVDVIRLQNARARLRDQLMKPATDVSFHMDLMATGLHPEGPPAAFEVQLRSPEALGALYLSGNAASRDDNVNADFKATMYGLDLRVARAYLAPFGIYPTAENLTGRATGKLTLKLLNGAAAVAAAARQPATQPSGATDPTFALNLSLDTIDLEADSKVAASVKSIVVDAPTLRASEFRVAKVDVDTVRVNAVRTKEGRFSFAGIEFVPVAASAPATQPVASAAPPTTMPLSASALIAELKTLNIKDVQLAFADDAMAEPVNLALNVPSVTIANLTTDPANTKPATLDARAGAKGIFEEGRVTGEIVAMKPLKTIDLTISGKGIAPDALATYLQPLGITSHLKNGTFAGKLHAGVEIKPDGGIAAELKANDIKFDDEGRSLLALTKADLSDFSVTGDFKRVRFGNVDIDGPTLPLLLARDGGISALGIRYKPVEDAAAPAAPATQPVAAATTQPSNPSGGGIALPVVEIGKIKWRGAGLSVLDQRNETPLAFESKDVTLDVENVTFDSHATTARPGTIRFAAKAPGLIETFNLDGTVAPTGGAIGLNFKGDGSGLTVNKLKDVLKPLGVEPIMKAGAVKFDGYLGAWQKGGLVGIDLGLNDCTLSDGDTKWLSLGMLQVKGVSFDGKTATVGWIEVTKPTAYVHRDADGVLSVAGIKLVPAPAGPQPLTAKNAPAAPTRVDLTLPIVGRMGGLSVTDGGLRIKDDAVTPPTEITLRADATLDKLSVGEDAPPTNFDVSFGSPDLLETGRATGAFKLAPLLQSIEVSASGTGLSIARIEPYLPPNIKGRYNGGAFAARLKASLQPNKDGGSTAALSITDAALRETFNGKPIAGVKSVDVKVNRVDLPGKTIALDEVSVTGAQLAVVHSDEGVSALGVTVGAKPFRDVPPPKPGAPAVASTQASDVDALVARGAEKPPLITIKKLNIAADRLSLTSPLVAKELAVVGFSLTNPAPIEVLGDNPQRQRPIELKMKTGVEGLVGTAAVDASLAPFASEPNATAKLRVDGIRGDQVTAFLPDLAKLIDGRDLADGSFTADLESRFSYTRRGQFGIDLTRDITSDVTIKGVRLTQKGVEKPLAGLDEVRADRIRYSPASGSVIVQAMELTNPMAHIVRDDAGIHAFGMTVKVLTNEPAAPTTAPAETAKSEPAPAPAPAEAPPAAASAAEYRIDQFRISGITLDIEDKVGDVDTYIPVNQLDVDVKGLTSRALTEPKPIRFSAIVGGGKVPLPMRAKSADPNATEERPIFSEASASGDFTLVPLPKGFVKLSMSGLELRALRGLTRQYKVDVTGGTFDVRCDVRMEGKDTFEAKLFPTFNEVRATEPPGGPIQSALNFSAPLDATIGILEAADGSITFPVVAPIEAGNIKYGPIINSVIASVGRVLGESVAGSLAKAAKFLSGQTGSERLQGIEPVVVTFAPGETQLTPQQASPLQAVIDMMKKDANLKVTIEQTLGTNDVTLASQRANPPREDAGALAARYREQKAQLETSLKDEVAKVRVAVASQSEAQASAALTALRTTSSELAATDSNLDLLLELQRPGAERYSERRTKAAAIIVGNQRIQSVENVFRAAGFSGDAKVTIKPAKFNPEDAPDGKITVVINRVAKQ